MKSTFSGFKESINTPPIIATGSQKIPQQASTYKKRKKQTEGDKYHFNSDKHVINNGIATEENIRIIFGQKNKDIFLKDGDKETMTQTRSAMTRKFINNGNVEERSSLPISQTLVSHSSTIGESTLPQNLRKNSEVFMQ